MKTKLVLNYNLKDKSSEYSLVYIIGYLDKRFKVSTQQKVYSNAWDTKSQRCIISTAFPDKINRLSKKINKFLDGLDKAIDEDFEKYPPRFDESNWYFGKADKFKEILQSIIERLINGVKAEEEKMSITPLEFFSNYVNTMHNRIDPHSKKFISERTIVHHRTVLHRITEYFEANRLKNDFSVFDSAFENKFTVWAFKYKGYHANTVPATMSVLKVWLNAAVESGISISNDFKSYKSKSAEVDNIYLTEAEIERIYELNIPLLKAKGLIDSKSSIEETRDLFIIGCWTGLRQSDLNRLNQALFDVEAETITIITEKTSEKVILPMHKFIKAIYQKYNGMFPKMCHKANFNKHLKELGRLAHIDDEVIIKENVAGKVTSTKYKKYQLIKSHTARRSFATNLYLKGAPTISIMKLTGHTTEANFTKYIKVTRQENAELLRSYF